MCPLRQRAREGDPQSPHLRVCGLWASDEPHFWYIAGEDKETFQSLVSRHLRDLDATLGHLSQRPAANHEIWLLQDGLELDAQIAERHGVAIASRLIPSHRSTRPSAKKPGKEWDRAAVEAESDGNTVEGAMNQAAGASTARLSASASVQATPI